MSRENDETSLPVGPPATLEAVLGSITDGVLALDREWRYTYFSEQAARMIGVRAEDMVGNVVWDLFPDAKGTAFYEGYHRAVDTGQVVHFEELYPAPLNLWLECHCYPSPDGLTVYFHDVTARKAAERTLDAERIKGEALAERHRALIQATGEIVWTNSPQGEMQGAQPGWCAYTGQSEEEAQGYGWSKAVHPDDAQPTIEAWKHAVATRSVFLFQHRVRRKDGIFRWFAIRGVPVLEPDGAIREWVGLHRDVDEEKKVAAHLERERRALAHANAELETSSRAKDEFLATMSHELRTPLNAMLGWATILRSERPDAATLARGLEIIERNARAQARIVEDLLDVSRIISGKLSLQRNTIAVFAILHAAAEVVRPAAEAKRVALSLDLDPDLGETVGDADRLQQVLWNLLTNAVRFTPSGGHVALSATRSSTTITLRVQDTGSGIPPEHLPYIFERFRQVDSSTTRAHGGLGLGLAIVRHLVEAHGGSVTAESAGNGLGAAFTVLLPIQAPTSPAAATPADTEEGRHGAGESASRRHAGLFESTLGDVHALVVDDDPDSLDLVCQVLERAGAKVTAASSAREALAATGQFTIILSDIGMPEMDGYAFMMRIRTRDPAATVPALALTAYARPEDAARALEAGFQAHIAKPIDMAQLLEAVRTWARIRR